MTTLCFVISPRGTAGLNKLVKCLDNSGLSRDQWSFAAMRADKHVAVQFATDADAAHARAMGWDPSPTEMHDSHQSSVK
jgi:hypothetical protein